MSSRLGKYQLGRVLGEGTFGKVRHAVDLETGEEVAIKVLDKQLITSAVTAEQIKKEIAVMMLVRQRHVVNLIEVLASRSKIFIVLELVMGGELFDRVVACGRLDESSARLYFRQLVTGLEFCHRQGVCHRDLKPENLLLDATTGDLKISDFGLSALYGTDKGTKLHTSCGTPHYVAPEVLGDMGYDGFKADVWSCGERLNRRNSAPPSLLLCHRPDGVILFVILAGFLPFDEPAMSSLFKKILEADFTCPDWFSVGACDLLSKVLHPEPAARYSLAQIKAHPWFSGNDARSIEHFCSSIDASGKRCNSVSGSANPLSHPRGVGKHGCRAGAGGADLQPQTINAFELITLCGGVHLNPTFAGTSMKLLKSTRFHSK
ncbi:MAG: hypothetical protein SGPRY_008874, partial [Prymnesium sp.]